MKLFLVLVFLGLKMAEANRSKRFLIFSPTSPTRVQLIAGIGIPVDLDYESVTLGYVLKAEYYLPDNTTLIMHFLQDPFSPITHPITVRRKRNALSAGGDSINQKSNVPLEIPENKSEKSAFDEHYEKYNVEAIEIDKGVDTDEEYSEYYDSSGEDDDEDKAYTAADYRISKPNDFSTARWSLFKGIEMLAERQGLARRPCMLRSICESAHAPFSFRSGILGELMQIIMTPSSTNDIINDHSQNEYFRAEELGRTGAPCEKVFKECTKSFLDQFSGIYSSMENVIKMWDKNCAKF